MKKMMNIALMSLLILGSWKLALADEPSQDPAAASAQAATDNQEAERKAKEEEAKKQAAAEEEKKQQLAQEEARKAEEAKRAEDEARKADEAKKMAAQEEARKADEASKIQAQEETRKAEEAKRMAAQDDARKAQQESLARREQAKADRIQALEAKKAEMASRREQQIQALQARKAESATSRSQEAAVAQQSNARAAANAPTSPESNTNDFRARHRNDTPFQRRTREIQVTTTTQGNAPTVVEKTTTSETFTGQRTGNRVETRRDITIDTRNRAPRDPQAVIARQRPAVAVAERDHTFTGGIRRAVDGEVCDVPATTRISIDEKRFRDRQIREREMRAKEFELRMRESQLRNRESQLTDRERAQADRQWYEQRLRRIQWDNMVARDQELSYLIWRERQINRYYWRDRDQVCHYVTCYKTGVRINRQKTICSWRNGVYSCFHPKKYFIYPQTKLVCYPADDRRVVDVIIRPYPY